MRDIRDPRKRRLINLKMSEKEYILLRAKAARYTDGNVSRFIRETALAYGEGKPRFVEEKRDKQAS